MADGASTKSRWITAARVGDDSLDLAQGQWVFETSVTLAAGGGSAFISGLRYAADNKLVDVTVNGVSVFQQPAGFAEEFRVWRTLGDVGLGLFEDGENVVRFTVQNQEGWNSPVGLRVEGAVVPEPAAGGALAAVGCLIGAGGGRRRWHRRGRA